VPSQISEVITNETDTEDYSKLVEMKPIGAASIDARPPEALPGGPIRRPRLDPHAGREA
jgi:hypothetical protein